MYSDWYNRKIYFKMGFCEEIQLQESNEYHTNTLIFFLPYFLHNAYAGSN